MVVVWRTGGATWWWLPERERHLTVKIHQEIRVKLWMVASVVVVWRCNGGGGTGELLLMGLPLRERGSKRVRLWLWFLGMRLFYWVGCFRLIWAWCFSLDLFLSYIYIYGI